jgi:hypothetical protein
MGYLLARIEELRAELAALPETDANKREVSKQEAVKLLARTIFALQRNGYTIGTIARLLSEKGLAITAPTLGNYVRRLRRRRPRKQKEGTGTAKAPPARRAEELANVAQAPDAPRAEAGKAAFLPREDSDEI